MDGLSFPSPWRYNFLSWRWRLFRDDMMLIPPLPPPLHTHTLHLSIFPDKKRGGEEIGRYRKFGFFPKTAILLSPKSSNKGGIVMNINRTLFLPAWFWRIFQYNLIDKFTIWYPNDFSIFFSDPSTLRGGLSNRKYCSFGLEAISFDFVPSELLGAFKFGGSHVLCQNIGWNPKRNVLSLTLKAIKKPVAII